MPQANRRIDRRAQRGGFVDRGALGAEIEDVRGDLHRLIRLARPPPDTHSRRSGWPVRALDLLAAAAQAVDQAFKNRAVQVRTRCATSPKPMIAPLASGPGSRTPGDQ